LCQVIQRALPFAASIFFYCHSGGILVRLATLILPPKSTKRAEFVVWLSSAVFFNLNFAPLKITMFVITMWILGIFASFVMDKTEACSCIPLLGTRDRFCKSNFVAIVNITSQTSNCQPTTSCYDFEIQKEFSRPKSSGLTRITTSYSSASCGVEFQLGNSYLIFANVQPGSESVQAVLCNSPLNWTGLSKKEQKKIRKDMRVKKKCKKVIPPA